MMKNMKRPDVWIGFTNGLMAGTMLMSAGICGGQLLYGRERWIEMHRDNWSADGWRYVVIVLAIFLVTVNVLRAWREAHRAEPRR